MAAEFALDGQGPTQRSKGAQGKMPCCVRGAGCEWGALAPSESAGAWGQSRVRL